MNSFLLVGKQKDNLLYAQKMFSAIFLDAKIEAAPLNNFLDQIPCCKPDAIIFTVLSVEEDILKACKKLRLDSQTKSIPVAILLNIGVFQDIDALEEIADVILSFPAPEVVIRSQIHMFIERNRLGKNIQTLRAKHKKSKNNWRLKSEKLREQEKLRKIIHQDVPVAIWLLDVEPDGTFRYLYQNEEAARSTGLSDKSIIKKTPQDLIPDILADNDVHNLINLYRECVKLKKTCSREWVVKIAGKLSWWKTLVSPVFNQQGDVYRILESSILMTEQKLAEESLRQSEISYRKLFEHNPQPMWIYDSDTFDFLKVNQAAVNHYGYTEEEFLSMTIKDIRPSEDVPKLLQDSIMKQDRYRNQGEWRHIKKNKALIHVEVVSHSILYKNRKARHVIIKDITENKKTLEILGKKNKALKQAQIIAKMGSWQYDFIKNKLVWSSNNFRIYGLEPFEIKPSLDVVQSFLHPGNKEILKESYQKLIHTRKPFEIVYKLFLRNHVTKWVQTRFSPTFKNDELVLLEGVNIDITKQKDFENELLAAKNKAEESERLKTAFLANMSHEIRTPMNGIMGFLGLLDNQDMDGEIQREFISNFKTSGQQLIDTITNIMEISKIESNEQENIISKTDILSLMNSKYNIYKSSAENKGLKFFLGPHIKGDDAIVLTDRQKINSILTNLLNNAVKFTDSGFIKLGNYKQNNNLIFYVKDTGKGIPFSCIGIIFKPFIQADMSLARKHEGSGLGLSISKAHVEALKGKIWVETEVGKGSTFFFSVPYVKEGTEIQERKLPEANH